MGNVTQRSFCDGCLDGAVVDYNSSGSGYTPYVYGGGDNGIPISQESGTANPQPSLCSGGNPGCAADLVTADSAFTGELTGLPVQAFNTSENVCDPYRSNCQTCGSNCVIYTLVHLSKVSNNGEIVVHEGDSGGPWIVRNGSSGTVSIAGVQSSASGCNNGACTTAYFTEIGYIDSKFDESVP